jgi:hypothetical protein
VEHLSEQTIRSYHDRKLVPAELIAADDHLASCDECYQRQITDQPQIKQSIASLSEDLKSGESANGNHVSYETLAALVDDEIDEISREIAIVHLEVCQQCADELNALEELKQPAPASGVQPSSIGSPKERKQAFLSFLTWPRFALATTVIIISTVILFIVWRSSQQSSVEVVESNVSGSASPDPSIASSSPQLTPSPVVSPGILVALNDAGGEVTLDDTGRIEGLGDVTPSLIESVRRALRTEKLNIAPALSGLQGKTGTLMGRSSEGVPFRLLEPVGIVIRGDRPTFRWQPLKGATSYVVKVYDTDFNEVARSLSQPATSWRVAAPLGRGVVYTWQVTAFKDGEEIKSPTPPAGEARFSVVTAAKLGEIERTQKAHANSHLILGTLYAEAGLLQDAQREFRLLLRANPQSAIAQKLLQQVSRSNASGAR